MRRFLAPLSHGHIAEAFRLNALVVLGLPLAALLGALASLVGLYISYYLNIASGSTIVLTATLFFLLAYAHFAKPGEGFEHFAGYEGIVCGLSAIYTGLAQVLNEVYGKTVWPLGPVKKS